MSLVLSPTRRVAQNIGSGPPGAGALWVNIGSYSPGQIPFHGWSARFVALCLSFVTTVSRSLLARQRDSGYQNDLTETCAVKPIFVALQEYREAQFSGAMAWRNPFQLQAVVQ